LLLEKGETGRWTARGELHAGSALLLQGVFDKTREPEGHPFYFLSCRFFSFLDECAIRVFSCSGALRRLLLCGLGIMGQELAKGHRTFSSAMGVPTGRLGKRQFRNDYWRYYYKRDSISTQALATSSADWRGVLLLMPDMTEPRRTKGHKRALNMV
jgi:hypothetical protein